MVCIDGEIVVISVVGDLVRNIFINDIAKKQHQESNLDFKHGRSNADYVSNQVVVTREIQVFDYANVIVKKRKQVDF